VRGGKRQLPDPVLGPTIGSAANPSDKQKPRAKKVKMEK